MTAGRCPSCGNRRPADANYCPQCGLPYLAADGVTETATTERPVDRSAKGTAWPTLLLVVAAVVVGGWWLLNSRSEWAGQEATGAPEAADAPSERLSPEPSDDSVGEIDRPQPPPEEVELVDLAVADLGKRSNLDPLAGHHLFATHSRGLLRIDTDTGDVVDFARSDLAGTVLGRFRDQLLLIDGQSRVVAVPATDPTAETTLLFDVGPHSLSEAAMIDDHRMAVLIWPTFDPEGPAPSRLLFDLEAGELLDASTSAWDTSDLTWIPGGGLFEFDDGRYRHVADGLSLVSTERYVLLRECEGPAECETRWIDRRTGAEVDRHVPAGEFWNLEALDPDPRVLFVNYDSRHRYFDTEHGWFLPANVVRGSGWLRRSSSGGCGRRSNPDHPVDSGHRRLRSRQSPSVPPRHRYRAARRDRTGRRSEDEPLDRLVTAQTACPSCAREFDDGARYCPFCGFAIKPPPPDRLGSDDGPVQLSVPGLVRSSSAESERRATVLPSRLAALAVVALVGILAWRIFQPPVASRAGVAMALDAIDAGAPAEWADVPRGTPLISVDVGEPSSGGSSRDRRSSTAAESGTFTEADLPAIGLEDLTGLDDQYLIVANATHLVRLDPATGAVDTYGLAGLVVGHHDDRFIVVAGIGEIRSVPVADPDAEPMVVHEFERVNRVAGVWFPGDGTITIELLEPWNSNDGMEVIEVVGIDLETGSSVPDPSLPFAADVWNGVGFRTRIWNIHDRQRWWHAMVGRRPPGGGRG